VTPTGNAEVKPFAAFRATDPDTCLNRLEKMRSAPRPNARPRQSPKTLLLFAKLLLRAKAFPNSAAARMRDSLAGALRLFTALAGASLISGCATLFGGAEAPAVDEAAVEAAQTRVTALQVEVSRLKNENARLANELLAIQRERARAERAAAEAGVADAAAAEAQQQQLAVPDPQPLANAVVDAADDPAIATTDVPVETAPRLVQPAFASNETVFENEADENAIETTSVLFGVHLASYRAQDEAREGWRKLQRENPDELGLLEPRVETVVIEDKGVFLRLIGGGFSSRERASALCDVLKRKAQFCDVVGFAGQRLSLAGETG